MTLRPLAKPAVRPAVDRLRTALVALTVRALPSAPTEAKPPVQRSFVARSAALGFVAILSITWGTSQPSSPFTLKIPGSWFFGIDPVGTHQNQQGLFLGLVAVYGGLVLLMRVWWGLARAARNREISTRDLMWVLALWVLPLIVAPPLFSRDVYSYAAQGEMMSHGISPYMFGPHVLGSGPYVTPVDPLWMNAPAPYGPLFLGIDGLLAKVTLHNALATVVALRLLELVGVALLAVYIPKLARTFNRSAGESFVLAVLNPVTLLELVGGAHNDALMLGLLVAGVTLARQKKPLAGIVLCALGAAIKVPAALGIVYIGWEWLGTGTPVRDRLRRVAWAGALGGVVMGALSMATGLGWGWVLNLATPGTVRSWLAPSTGIGMIVSRLVHGIGIGISSATVLSITRVVGLAIAAGVGLFLLAHSDRIGALRAMGVTMLLVVVLGPVVQPWYLSWGLVLLVPVSTGWLRKVLIVGSIVSPFIGLPGGRQLIGDLLHANPILAAVSAVALVTVLTAPLGASLRHAPQTLSSAPARA